MDAPKHKLYHEDGICSRSFIQTYFTTDRETAFCDESLIYPMKKLHDSLAAGHFKGNTVYDISIGSIIHQLFTVSDYYSEITILRLNDTCIMELNKWLAVRTGAFDWTPAYNYAKELEGTSDQEDLNKGEKLKNAIKRIMKFDLQNPNLTDPEVLEPADSIITAWLLDAVSKDQDDYIKYLQSITKLLKPGGLLIVVGSLNATYYKVGEDKYHVFTYDESFLRKTLANEGYKIHTCEVLDRTIESDLSDYKHIIFVTAVKEAA